MSKIYFIFLILILSLSDNVYSNQNDSTSFVEISNIVKLKIPLEIFKDFEGRIEPGTEDIIADDGIEHNFPHNFFITQDEKIMFDIYREDGYSILQFDKYGELKREIKLHQYSDYFKEKASVYNALLVNNNLLISGLYKFFLIDIKEKTIMMESEKILRGLGVDYYSENKFFMTFTESISSTTIRRIKIYDNGKMYYHPNALKHHNDVHIIDSLIICPLYENVIVSSIDTNIPTVNYQYNLNDLGLKNQYKEVEIKFIGGNKHYYYIVVYSQALQPNDTFNNAMFYQKPDIHIVKLNKEFEFDSIAKLNYDIKLNQLYIEDRMQLTFSPCGLLFHFSKYFDKLYVLYFSDDGSFIGEIDLNW